MMGMAEPLAVPEAAQDASDRFREVTICAEFGDGWSCTQPAMPDGPPRCIGRDDRGYEVWMRRWRCIAGHWYDLEAPARGQTSDAR
jgi:hypothetical protein